jgi:hypothetical protein
VIEYHQARQTYVCMLDALDVEGHMQMNKRELMDARLVEFTPDFLLKHCKEI